MAATAGHGHGNSPVPGIVLGGSNTSAALPAIGLASLGGGGGGSTSPLGRERSGMSAMGGPPRKEMSYASSTASKISIASLPLETLEHIMDDFRAQQQYQKHHPHQHQQQTGGPGRGRGGGPTVRINAAPEQHAAGGHGHGHGHGRSWNAPPGGVGRRPPGAGPGSMSFSFAARPATPPGGSLSGGVPAPAMGPQQLLPGMPPGAAPLALSRRAAAVLQGSESAAHLQRFLALDPGQFENHFIISSPNGAPLMDLQEICFDGAASIDGLPHGREAVVVLTNAADGVPVPRLITLDQPGPHSLRRTGMTAVLAAAAASGTDSVDAVMKSSASSGSLMASGQPSQADLAAAMADGGDDGDAPAAAWSPNPAAAPNLPLSPQRSALQLNTYANSPRAAGGGGGSHMSARRSDTGGSRCGAYGRQQSTPPPLPPGAPLSPPLRTATASPLPLPQQQQPNHHHFTSTYNMLPALGDGAGGGGAGGGGGGGAGRPTPPRGSSYPRLTSGRRGGLSEPLVPPLPLLMRMNSPEHLPPAAGASGGPARDTDGDAGGGGGSESQSASGEPPGAGGGAAQSPGGPGASSSTSVSPRQWSAGRPGMTEAQIEGSQSPSRTRLQARITTLQTERHNQHQVHHNPHSTSPHPHHLAGGAGKGVSASIAASRVVLNNLSGMDLVRAALKQVETGERTLADAPGRTSTSGADRAASAGSRRTSTTSSAAAAAAAAAVAAADGEGEAGAQADEAEQLEEEEEEREAAERRQARLVRSLTMLLTTGRRGRPSTATQSLETRATQSYKTLRTAQSYKVPRALHSISRREVPSEKGGEGNDDEEEEEGEEGEGEEGKGEGSEQGGEGGDKQPASRSSPPSQDQQQEEEGQMERPGKNRGGDGAAAAVHVSVAERLSGSQEQPPPQPLEDAFRSASNTGDGADDTDTLDAAAAVAADGGLDPDALIEFAQQLDRANEEFRLVEAARERSRRVEAIMSQAHLSTHARGSAVGEGGRVSSPERLGQGGSGPDLHLLARRRDGSKSHNVTQVISSMEAPLDRPMEVDLEQLLGAIGEALLADEQDVRATRFDETFRIRTERYLIQLCRLNPAAFEEVSAAQAEADYRSSVERAKLRLRQLHGEVAGEPLTSAGKPRSQYDKAVVMLQAHRPFFLPPVMLREAVERAPVPPMLGGRGYARPPWDVYASIFRERKRGDARDLYDNDGVLAAQFNLDWSRTVSKMLFMKLVAREDLGVRGKSGRVALELELTQVREALLEAFGLIRSAFTYYSIATPEEVYTAAVSAAVGAASASGGSAEAAAAEVASAAAAAAARRGGPAPSPGSGPTPARATSPDAPRHAEAAGAPPPSLAESAAAVAAAAVAAASGGPAAAGYGILEMDEQRWLAFCTSAGVTGRATGVRVSDLRLLFWTVNREEERNMTLESVENNDYAFMRFEFMEALVRAAFGRYITPGTLRDASEATRRLVQHLRSSLPPLAMVDPNDFRRQRLYTAEMEVAVVHNLELLTASFKLYKARDRAKYLSIDHWISFLETNNLMAPHMGGMTPTEARLAFAWSQMVVVDELKLRRRAVSLQLWDFVEAVARLAECIALPTTEEMDKWMLYNLNIGRNTPLPPGHTRVWTYCNALASGRVGPGLERRASGRELLSPSSRTLAAKFRLMMEYLAGSLADAWGGNNTHETAQSMLRTANMLCGGVELA